jgi:predicted nucleotidyltransferase
MEAIATQQDAVLDEMVRRLVNAFHPDLVYLYGSRARGDATENSDYDLLVVVAESDLPFRERWLKAFGLLSGMGVPKDVVVLTREEFHKKREVVCSLPATAVREGKLVYAA